jgi:DNA-binding transcriptional ArsR family regulator
MSLLPSQLDVSASPDEPRVLDIDGDRADDAFDALSSETARRVLSATYEEPRTPSEVQDEVGTSLQNVHYHLEKLEDAGLIEPAGTGYSEKGNEMTVYAPQSEAVVLFAGDDEDGSRLRDQLRALFGLVLTVGVATAVFAVVRDRLAPSPAPEPTEDTAMRVADAAGSGVGDAAAIDPVVAFFLGGSVVVAAVACWWLLRPRLPSLAPFR